MSSSNVREPIVKQVSISESKEHCVTIKVILLPIELREYCQFGFCIHDNKKRFDGTKRREINQQINQKYIGFKLNARTRLSQHENDTIYVKYNRSQNSLYLIDATIDRIEVSDTTLSFKQPKISVA